MKRMKRPATRTEIAKRQHTSRTTVYRAVKYLETRGEFITPRKPIAPTTFSPYRYLYKDVYKNFTRNFYDTPDCASVNAVVREKKPAIVMLQGWFQIDIYERNEKGEYKLNTKKSGISSGISIPIERAEFSCQEKMAELKRYATANLPSDFDSDAVLINISAAKDKNGKPRLRTICYFVR